MREVVRESVQGAMEGAGGQGRGDQPSGAAVARSMAGGRAGNEDASRESGQAGAMASMQQTANRAIWVVVGSCRLRDPGSGQFARVAGPGPDNLANPTTRKALIYQKGPHVAGGCGGKQA